MKRNNKKGFTIVELVIVIAVIAILSAVLIPTFSGIVKKARISADTQVARNLNTSLAADEALNGKPENFSEVLNILKDDGYIISNINPTMEGWYYVWESESNQILLVDGKYNIKHSSKDFTKTEPCSTWHFAISDAEKAVKLETALAGTGAIIRSTIVDLKDLSNALSSGGNKTLYIDENIVLNSSKLSINDSSSDLVLNLNNSSITGDRTIDISAGKIEINGGIIGTTGKQDESLDADGDLVTNPLTITGDSEVLIKNTQIEISLTNGFVYTHDDSNTTFENVVINSIADNGFCSYADSTVLLKNVEINTKGACVFASGYKNGAHTGTTVVTIDSGEYNSEKGNCIWAYTGTVKINGGEFNSEQGKLFTVNKANNLKGTIIITGGTFNGVSFEELDTVEEWKALCSADYNVTIADGAVTIVAK